MGFFCLRVQVPKYLGSRDPNIFGGTWTLRFCSLQDLRTFILYDILV